MSKLNLLNYPKLGKELPEAFRRYLSENFRRIENHDHNEARGLVAATSTTGALTVTDTETMILRLSGVTLKEGRAYRIYHWFRGAGNMIDQQLATLRLYRDSSLIADREIISARGTALRQGGGITERVHQTISGTFTFEIRGIAGASQTWTHHATSTSPATLIVEDIGPSL